MNYEQSSCNDINEPGLMPVAEARARILTQIQAVSGHQYLPIEQCRGRILAEDMIAPRSVPIQDNSAVDGYAFCAADQADNGATQLTVIGTALAGVPFSGSVARGQCVRITTGAALPDGADTVIMQEQVQIRGGNTIRFDERLKHGQNVRYAGEDLKQGQCILPAGKYLLPADIGLMASLGLCEIQVRRPLRIAIASTGNELIDPGNILESGRIYDSNRYSLTAALDKPGLSVIDLGILADDPDTLLTQFRQAADSADLLITSGGVSVGEADYTKTALQQAGHIDFWKIAIKPGRPLAFGSLQNKPFFGLPGNPVAVLVTFYQFVLPALEKMLGLTGKPIAPILKARALEPLSKKPGRTEIQRGWLEPDEQGQWTVRSTGKQGSGILHSISSANAFIVLPHDSGTIDAGDWVAVQPFAGLFWVYEE